MLFSTVYGESPEGLPVTKGVDAKDAAAIRVAVAAALAAGRAPMTQAAFSWALARIWGAVILAGGFEGLIRLPVCFSSMRRRNSAFASPGPAHEHDRVGAVDHPDDLVIEVLQMFHVGAVARIILRPLEEVVSDAAVRIVGPARMTFGMAGNDLHGLPTPRDGRDHRLPVVNPNSNLGLHGDLLPCGWISLYPGILDHQRGADARLMKAAGISFDGRSRLL
ncbi:MAG: hypothetical protein U1F77_02165 [Kiritimatiellia bacterium]